MLKYLLSIITLLTITMLTTSTVSAAYTLNSTASFTGATNTAIPINDLQISGTGSEPIPVRLRVASGTLQMSTTTGLTFTGGTSGATLYFSGTLTNINAALATLTYTRASAGTDTLEVSLSEPGEVFFSENGHLYEFISGTITANNARTAAAGLSAYGASGYLATITSQEENDFVAARLQGDGWMGASDAASEGDWKWLDGPEAGTSFWSGASGGSTVGGNYANWAPGEPNDYNNGSPGEDCAQFYISTSRWNDLPCSSTTLSGYVVEYGAPGDLPTVVATNISLQTITPPTVNTLTPADNATGITLSTNLTIQFSQTVNKGTGNILIHLISDDTTVETIDVTSGLVTGQGTNTITIDPSSNLSESTAYYITIPNTAFLNTSSIAYAGISNTTTWNFTTGDFTAPTLSNISASPTNNTATITWTSDENASTRLSYGLTSSYGTTTPETDTSPRVTSHSVSLSSLLACTTYHYQVISTDGSTNTTESSGQTFTTTGCQSDQTPTTSQTQSITASSGGTTTLTENSRQLQVQTPADFTDEASTVVIQIKALPKDPILTSLGRPSSLPHDVSPKVFDVKAIINGTTELDSFDTPVTITYQYTDEDIGNLDESTLWLYHYTGGAWVALDDCSLNTSTNTISCTTPSFSIFGLFGNVYASSSDNSPQHSSPTCNAQIPPTGTNLFQIDANNTQATLYFTPQDRHVTGYFITYGYTPEEERFATIISSGPSGGVLAYTINELNPNSTYYFKLQPLNNCASGQWSNQMQIKTISSTNQIKRHYKNFLARMFSRTSGRTTSLNTTPTPNPTPSTPQACTYTVKSGDSLWSIALDQLGAGTHYTQLLELNNLPSHALSINQQLKLPCN